MHSKPKILIIDDEEVVLDSCIQILGGESFQVSTASNGSDGLRLVQELQPDLVIVDLKMPGISGFEVLDRLEEIDPTIVMIVITGFATVSSAVDAMKKGAYDFLPKPFSPEEFRIIIRRGLEKRKLILETIMLRHEKELLREHFAHIVSHELKAPLNAVQQNIFALEFELSGVLNEDQKEKLVRIKVRMEDLLKIIDSWLRIISVNIEELEKNFSPIQMTTPIYKALENIETIATRKSVEIVSSFGVKLHPVWGDVLSLSEAFVNIIGNAIQYSRDGSKVIVKAEENGTDILVTIKDFGIGIPKEDLPHIFEGFFRVKSGQAAPTGHGIGLVVSRQIIEAHSGSITVESETGTGTAFYIRLPKYFNEKSNKS